MSSLEMQCLITHKTLVRVFFGVAFFSALTDLYIPHQIFCLELTTLLTLQTSIPCLTKNF